MMGKPILPIVIGFFGYAGAGKDFCANILAQLIEARGLRVTRIAFADSIRAKCWESNRTLDIKIDGLMVQIPFRSAIALAKSRDYPCCKPVDIFSHVWTNENCKDGYEVAKRLWPEIRAHLVEVGQVHRVIDPLFWIKEVMPNTRDDLRFQYCFHDVVIVTDVRQRNEANAIRNLSGHIIGVERASVGPADPTEAHTIAEILADESMPKPFHIFNRDVVSLRLELGEVCQTILTDFAARLCKAN